MYLHNPASIQKKWDAQTHMGFWDTNGWRNHVQKNRNYNDQQKKKRKRTFSIVDFDVLADHRVKLKENENKYLDLDRELKKKPK